MDNKQKKETNKEGSKVSETLKDFFISLTTSVLANMLADIFKRFI